MIRRPRRSTLFPYTTLFRSQVARRPPQGHPQPVPRRVGDPRGAGRGGGTLGRRGARVGREPDLTPPGARHPVVRGGGARPGRECGRDLRRVPGHAGGEAGSGGGVEIRMRLHSVSEGWLIAVEQLRANKLRSALTILGVVIGVATVMAMASIVQGIRDQIINTIDVAGPTTFYILRFWSTTPLNPDALPKERSEEHTSELQSLAYLVCRLLLEKKKTSNTYKSH